MLKYAVLIGRTKEDVDSFFDPSVPDGFFEYFVFNEYEDEKMFDFVKTFIERKDRVALILPWDHIRTVGDDYDE